jgi:hypothetical protein
MEVKLDFTDDEMKYFILKTGKYKVISVNSLDGVPWFLEWEETVEVAYLIDDIETEKWIMSGNKYTREFIDKNLLISDVFEREFKSKLLNL